MAAVTDILETRLELLGLSQWASGINTAVGTLGVFGNKLENLEQDIRNVEKDVRELRHGEGFVRGTRGIDREYPA